MYLCVCIPELCAIHFLDAVVHVSLCRVYLYVICADDCERVSVSCIDASVIIGPAAIAGPDRAKYATCTHTQFLTLQTRCCLKPTLCAGFYIFIYF